MSVIKKEELEVFVYFVYILTLTPAPPPADKICTSATLTRKKRRHLCNPVTFIYSLNALIAL